MGKDAVPKTALALPTHAADMSPDLVPTLLRLRELHAGLESASRSEETNEDLEVSLLISRVTLDDVMRCALEELLDRGEPVSPSKGNCRELRGVLLEITNPRARLSRSESRGQALSCLGELCWYLSGTNKIDFIEYYIPKYHEFAEEGILFGAYGPRLLAFRGVTNQLENIISILKRKSSSRQAVIQLFDAEDVINEHKDVPCTSTIQFLLRSNHLEMITTMRSNDAYLGLPHDVFCFTMIQEIVARRLGVDLGTYRHVVGSLHLYDRDIDAASRYLAEGWQPTTEFMPSMPLGDPTVQLRYFLDAERNVRLGRPVDLDEIGLEKYWADLVRLLQLYHYSTKIRDSVQVHQLCKAVDSRYAPYFEKMRARVAQQVS